MLSLHELAGAGLAGLSPHLHFFESFVCSGYKPFFIIHRLLFINSLGSGRLWNGNWNGGMAELIRRKTWILWIIYSFLWLFSFLLCFYMRFFLFCSFGSPFYVCSTVDSRISLSKCVDDRHVICARHHSWRVCTHTAHTIKSTGICDLPGLKATDGRHSRKWIFRRSKFKLNGTLLGSLIPHLH